MIVDGVFGLDTKSKWSEEASYIWKKLPTEVVTVNT